MKKFLITGSAVLMLTFFCSPVVLAQSPIGTVTYLEGVGDITRNDQGPVSLKENDEVFVSDRIRTKSYSKAQITFADKSVLKLAPGSCVTIEEFKMSGGQKREFARCKLSRGKLEAIVSKTGRPETFVIDTPNAKGAVKGSDIFVSYLGGRTGIFVKEGALSVWNPALPDTKATIVKGNCAFVPFNEAPGGERSILDTEMLIHKRDVEHALVKKWIPSKGSFKMNAVIVAVSGTVRIYKKEALDWKDAAMDEVFMEGDILQTAIDGQVSVRLNNGNVLFVAGNTELSVTTLRYDSKSG
ncbi:MAG: FecR family protein, partial [Candidatus Omnitrophica bacterium]|nr:FecR family protein [Candidatus Omnitrophota bacterium]